jgi:hypothetical protein
MDRDFPQQYSEELIKVLKAISIGDPIIVGSAVDHRILYSADYDLIEDVILRKSSPKSFQNQIKKLNKIGTVVDLKIGEISEWNLLQNPYIENSKVKKYDQAKELKHLRELWTKEIITHDEFMNAEKLLKDHFTPHEFLKAKKELRFGILRWTSKEVYEGYKELRDESIIYLEDAFKTKGITKIDLVAWINNKYMEISNIILWTNSKGKYFPSLKNLEKSLSEDILVFESESNYIKIAKRLYSLSKNRGDINTTEKLIEILNSPIGKLYIVLSDLLVLRDFPNAITPKRKRKELDLLRDSFAKLYYPQFNHAIPDLKLIPKMEEVLQEKTKEALKVKGLFPIHKDYLL